MAYDHQYTAIWTSSKVIVSSISSRLVAIAHNFYGAGTILMAHNHRYTTIWTWSKLVVLAISGRFRGL